VVVGISGAIAAGKTTAARYLEKHYGFAYGRYSEVLAQMLKADGVEVNRQTLQKLGDRVHRKPGQRWLSRQLVNALPKDRDLVIDGLRFPEDHAYLAESFGPAFIHINVAAAEPIRKKRYIKDGGTGADFDLAAKQPVEAKIPLLAAAAHAHINNEEAELRFKRAVADAAQELGQVTFLAMDAKAIS
jgi:dephospho-CoA kinase